MATMYEKMMERLVDRVADQAVELAKKQEEIAALRKEMAWYDAEHKRAISALHEKLAAEHRERDQAEEERDVLAMRLTEARQEPFEQLCEAVLALDLHDAMGVQRLQDQARCLLYPEKRKKLEVVS